MSDDSDSETKNLQQLIIKRRSIKGRITKFNNYLNSLPPADVPLSIHEYSKLCTQLENFLKMFERFEGIQSDIETLNPKYLDDELEERDKIESSFHENIAIAKCRLGTNAQPRPSNAGNLNESTSCLHHCEGVDSGFRLPVIKIPNFDGSYFKWLSFHDTFESLVHKNDKIKPIHKFHYLCSYLEGEASRVISNLEISDNNYLAAWSLLCERYSNKRQLINNHLNSLFKIDPIARESDKSLRFLVDHVTKNLRALLNLGQPTDKWDTLIIHLLSSKLDTNTSLKWEEHRNSLLSSEMPTLDEFHNFLKGRADVLESVYRQKQDKSSSSYVPTSTTNSINKVQKYNKTFKHVLSATPVRANQDCFVCKGSHRIYDYPSFAAMDIDERIKQASALKLCLNCLRSGHHTSSCKLSSCRYCQKRHNTMLHKQDTHTLISSSSINENNHNNSSSSNTYTDNQTSLSSSSIPASPSNQVLLSTALVNILNPVNKRIEAVKALLDCGSTSSFISHSLKQRLGLVTQPVDTSIVGIGNSTLEARPETCTITLQSRCSQFSVILSCLVLPQLTDVIPKYPINKELISIPGNITLADPSFHIPSEIHMLIGADLFWDLLNPQQQSLGRNLPFLRSSKLGWFLAGPLGHNHTHSKPNINTHISCNLSVLERVDNQMSKFWELESLPERRDSSRGRLDEENPCEKHFLTHTVRLDNGRFSVRLPLIDTPDALGDSYHTAKKRFFSLEKRFERQPILKEMYCNFMQEYEDLGHMAEANIPRPALSYFIPHHAVLREKSESTKLRVVYDASCRTSSGLSINDLQMIGPNIQDSLFNILIRFRQHKYVLTGDIEKMYRQIQVNESDRDLQLILWRDDSSSPLKTYRLNTVTYGFASASYLSTRCIWQLGEECHDERIKTILQNDFYVDDLITSCSSESELLQIQDAVSNALATGCFTLRKYRSNSTSLLEKTLTKSQDNLAISQSCDTLGLNWNPNADSLQFPISIQTNGNVLVTKRSILSQTFKIFDPLGLLSPCTIKPKILMQRLWTLKVDWDTIIPVDIQQAWNRFINKPESLTSISIPRNVIRDLPVSVELHAFGDASQAAYAACIYVKSVDQAGNVSVHLYCAKARVSPSKPVLTIPRLELCGALLAAKLMATVRSALRMQINAFHYWTDSSIVLGWLGTEPSRLKQWVCNRVSQINELTNSSLWRHVPTAQNPADMASRGVDPNHIENCTLWWFGPPFLTKSEAQWPSLPSHKVDLLPEVKVHVSSATKAETISPFIDILKYSNLKYLQRVSAYMHRFIHNCKFPKNKYSGPLQVQELETALTHLIKLSQLESFPQEINILKNQAQLKPKSHIVSLNPFLDSQGLLRVGGRISNSNYDFDKKHPIMLSSKHHLTKMLFQQEHIKLLHAGPQTLLSAIRDRFWPVGGRDLARRTARSCIKCRRLGARAMQNIMGNLPADRLSGPDFAFSTVAVDLGGPFMITDRKGRGCKITKAYLCLFICFRTKCVHLEAVSELSKEAFILTLRRFIARRGKPRRIFCDNGRNFVAAARELSNFLKENSRYIIDNASDQNIEFQFSPAYAPNFNGLVEAGIKSAKHHLRRILGDNYFTFEELSTIFAQVEAVLNSRPLGPLSSSPNDFTPLTPGHFLIGRPLTSLPSSSLEDVNSSRLNRYQRIEQARQHFWRRWQSEYISELQHRLKWRVRCRDLQPGDVVLLKEDHTPPLQWRLGRVERLFPGADGVPRVADIRTAKGVVRRALSKICLLQAEASNRGQDVRAHQSTVVKE